MEISENYQKPEKTLINMNPSIHFKYMSSIRTREHIDHNSGPCHIRNSFLITGPGLKVGSNRADRPGGSRI